MSRLYLLRHAKAAWAQPGMRDFDRPLEPSGRGDAEALGGEMARLGYAPERVLCSTALRARETWAGIARQPDIGAAGTTFDDGLYNSDATGYLALIRRFGEADSILIVGHNPMMEDLAGGLAGDGEADALARLSRGFPACGLAVIRFSGSLAQAAPGEGHLEAFLVPSPG